MARTIIDTLSNKCSVGQSYTTNLGSMTNGVNGTVNVKIKELKV